MKTPLQPKPKRRFLVWEDYEEEFSCRSAVRQDKRSTVIRISNDIFFESPARRGIAPALTEFVKFIAAAAFALLLTAFASASDLAAQVRDEINLARTAPQQYAQILASHMAGYHGIEGESAVREAIHFLEKEHPLPPLILSEGISSGALTHVLELGPTGGRGHVGVGGTMPWDRMARFGQWSGHAGENIYYGQRDARGIVIALIVDDGERSRGHRKNIFSPAFHFAGIACGPHASFGKMCVIDFADAFVEGGTRMALPIASL